jgi:hypothetical protein
MHHVHKIWNPSLSGSGILPLGFAETPRVAVPVDKSAVRMLFSFTIMFDVKLTTMWYACARTT